MLKPKIQNSNLFSCAARILFMLSFMSLAASGWTEPRMTGVRELSDEELAAYHERMFVPEPPPRRVLAALPEQHQNIFHLPVVRSQGQMGSCAAFAVTYYYKTYQKARKNNWERPDPAENPEQVASPMWTFNLLGASLPDLDPPVWADWIGNPVSHYSAADLFIDHGVATWEELPYSLDHLGIIPDDMDVWVQAMHRRTSRMGRIPNIDTPAGLAMLKRHLAGGDLAVICIHDVYENFDNYPTADGDNGVDNCVYFRDHGSTRYSQQTGHALTVVGYDDNLEYVDDRTGETRRGALLAVNSWGQWGTYIEEAKSAGFVWFAYDYLYEGGLGTEALIMEDRINHEPQSIAIVGIDADNAYDVSMNPVFLRTQRGQRRVFPPMIQPLVIDGQEDDGHLNEELQRQIPIDVTDLLDPPVSQLDLWFINVWGSPPTLTDFRLETPGGEILMVSDEMPVRIDEDPNPHVPGHTIALRAFQKQSDSGLETARIQSGSAAFADVNNNGHLDLITTGERYDSGDGTNVPSTTLWLNQGDGTFAPGAAEFPATTRGAAVWSDVNNSGAPDLWLATENDTRLYENDGAGNFADSGIRLPAAGSAGGGGYLTVIDYNRNGRPDLAMVNEDGVFVYQQRTDGTFMPINLDTRGSAVLDHLGDAGSSGAMAWGDSDGDGYPDLLVTGLVDPADETRTPRTVLYRNHGNDTFGIVETDLPDLAFSTAAWTDFNNNGIDDLAVSGLPAEYLGSSATAVTRIFRGTGDGALKAVDGLDCRPGLYRGGMHWVDLDHNGRRDLLLTGREKILTGMGVGDGPDHMFPTRLRIWRNRTDQLLDPVDHDLPGVGAGPGVAPPLAIGDVNSDGAVDFFASGTQRQSGTIQGEDIIGYLTRNFSAAFPAPGGANDAPSAPTLFDAEIVGDGTVKLSWDGADDDLTPAAGLRYIVRIGTAEDTWDVASGIVQPYDFGNLVRSGVSYHELPPGEIYWAVRTVDAGLAMSEWSETQTVTVPGYAHTPLVWIEFDSLPEYGGVTDPPETIRIARDSVVSVSAIAMPGFSFSHWSGDGPDGETDNPLYWTAAQHARLEAVFDQNPNPATPPWTPVTGKFGVHPQNFAAGLAAFDGLLYQLGGHGALSRNSYVYFAGIEGVLNAGEIEWDWDFDALHAPWPNRSHHGVEVFDQRLWVIGGSGGSSSANQPLNDVWSMDSQRNWTEITGAAAWSARHDPATAVYDDYLWVIGGREHLSWGSAVQDVWKSDNGADWTLVTDHPPWQAERVVALPFDGQLFLLTHPAEATPYNPGKRGEVWVSSNGADWERLTDNGPWGRSFEAVVHDNRIVVVTGLDAPTAQAGQAVWDSTDGMHWVRTAPQPQGGDHWSPREYPVLAVGEGHIWLASGRGADGTVYDDVWHYDRGSLPAGQGRLRLTSSPYDGGMLKPAPGAYVDDLGVSIPLRAIPAHGFLFDGWDGPVADPESAETTVLLDADTRVHALFIHDGDPTIDEVTLNIQVDAAGGGICRLYLGYAHHVTPAEGDYLITMNQDYTLRAIPESGYRFSHWSGPVAEPLQQQTTVNTATDIAVTAHFKSQSLAAGVAHTAVLSREETLWVWGKGNAGQSGRGKNLRVEGLPPLAERESVARVVAGDELTATLKRQFANRDILVWGRPWTAARPADNAWEVEPYTVSLEDGTISQFAAGGRVMMVLDMDGRLWAAGSRDDGMLGGFTADTTDLVAVRGVGGQGALGDIVDVAVGSSHVLAIDTRGRALGWGRNQHGQVDPMHADLLDTPVIVQNLPLVRAVAASRDPLHYPARSYALDLDGKVWQWGAGRDVPELVDGLPDQIVAIAAGGRHALALDDDGIVYAWGKNGNGQLGDGTDDDRVSAVAIEGLPPIVEIVAGFAHSVALAADGRVYAWGDNTLGVVSGTPGEAVLSPVEIEAMHLDESSFPFTLSADPSYGGEVVPRHSPYRARPGGEIPLLAIPSERYRFSVWSGQVDRPSDSNTTVTVNAPVEISAHFELRPDADARLTMNVDPEDAGYTIPEVGEHDLMRGARVAVEAHPLLRHVFAEWEGAVDDVAARETETVLNVDRHLTARFDRLPFSPVPMLAGGSFRNLLVLYGNGRVRHLTGDPDWSSSWSWITVDGQFMESIVKIARSSHGLALHADGYVYAWGPNREGQCGRGFFSSWQYPDVAPGKVLGPDDQPLLRGAVDVASAWGRSLALMHDGRVMQWGEISGYPVATTNRPVTLLDATDQPVKDATFIAGGGARLGMIRAPGNVWTWQGTNTPAKIGNINDATQLALGENHALALRANGAVVAWGDNEFGQLGQGHTNPVSDPVNIPGLSQIIAIEAGPHYNLALNAAGQVYAWGRNHSAQLGDGTQTDRTQPVLIDGLENIRGIAAAGESSPYAGRNTSFALDADGRLYCWGAVHTLNPTLGVTLTPETDSSIDVGDMNAQMARLDLDIEQPREGGEIFPAPGSYMYNAGDPVELRATPAEDYRFDAWSDGNTQPTRTIVMHQDQSLSAQFVFIEPTMRLEHVEAQPGESATMRLLMEEGKVPYAGFNAALYLPPGIELRRARRGDDVGDGFLFDTATRRLADGGTLVSLAAFSSEDSVAVRDGEWARLTLRPTLRAAGGVAPVTWVDGRAWTRCPAAVLAETNGLATVRPTRVSGSVTVAVESRIHAALRIVDHAAGVNRMSNQAFADYRNRTQYTQDEPYLAEIWLRCSGTGTVGIAEARLNLEVYAYAENDPPATLGTPQHGMLFGQNTGGTLDETSLIDFGGASPLSSGEGRDEWVRLGWVEISASSNGMTQGIALRFGEPAPVLADDSAPDDMAVLDSPVAVRIVGELERAALGTPHWWLDVYNLIHPGIDYDEAETTDFRGDGMIARQAYIAGVEPTDPNSRFIVAEILRAANKDSISWPGLAGRRYRVYRTSTLIPEPDWGEPIHVEKCHANRVITFEYSHDAETEEHRFYRIDVELME